MSDTKPTLKINKPGSNTLGYHASPNNPFANKQAGPPPAAAGPPRGVKRAPPRPAPQGAFNNPFSGGGSPHKEEAMNLEEHTPRTTQVPVAPPQQQQIPKKIQVANPF